MLDKILLPIDLSASQESITSLAKELDRRYSPAMHLLFVVKGEEASDGRTAKPGTMPNKMAKIMPAVESKMERYVRESLDHLEKVTMEVVVGEPAEEVVRYAVEKDINLILMASQLQGSGDPSRSVTAKVVRTSPVPVLSYNAALS